MNNRQEQNTQKVKAILLLIFFWYSKYYLKTCVLKQTKKMRFRMFVIEKLFYIHCGEYGMRFINAFGCFDVFNNNFPFFERTKCQNFQHKNAKQLEKMPTQFYSTSCLIFCHLNFEFEVFRICMRKKENCEWRANDREWWKQRPVSSQESDGTEWILWVIKTTTTTTLSTSFNVSVCHWEKMQKIWWVKCIARNSICEWAGREKKTASYKIVDMIPKKSDMCVMLETCKTFKISSTLTGYVTLMPQHAFIQYNFPVFPSYALSSSSSSSTTFSG